jgi:hypothetical protein
MCGIHSPPNCPHGLTLDSDAAVMGSYQGGQPLQLVGGGPRMASGAKRSQNPGSTESPLAIA